LETLLSIFLSNTFERGETFGTDKKSLKKTPPKKDTKKDHAHKKKREFSRSLEQKRKKEKKRTK